MMATDSMPNDSCAAAMVWGITCDSARELRKMKSPMSVMPGAVLDTATTGTPCSCAIGSVENAVFDSVGPMMTLTSSWFSSFSKAVMPWAGSEASSSWMTS